MTEASKVKKWARRAKWVGVGPVPACHKDKNPWARPNVITSGVSCRMGVGGRRGRKRLPAKIRKARAFADSELSVCEKLMRMRPVSPKEAEALKFRIRRIERRHGKV